MLSRIDPTVPQIKDGRRGNLQNLHRVYPTMRFRVHRWKDYQGWWRIAVVRDPIKRLMSLYTDCIDQKRYLFNSPNMARQRRLPLNPDPNFFFTHLDRYMAQASVIKHHALPAALAAPIDDIVGADEFDNLVVDTPESRDE